MTVWAYDFNPCSVAHAFEPGAAASRCGQIPLAQADPLGRGATPPERACGACLSPPAPRVGLLAALAGWSFRLSYAVRKALRDRSQDDWGSR